VFGGNGAGFVASRGGRERSRALVSGRVTTRTLAAPPSSAAAPASVSPTRATSGDVNVHPGTEASVPGSASGSSAFRAAMTPWYPA
jgi:hypothetical protein